MADRREVILELLARDKSGPGTRSFAGNVKTVGEAAEGAAKSTEKLGKESDKADGQVQRFGRSAKTAAGHVDDLDGEIENVERELVRLAVAWKEAEGATEKLDLSKAIRRTQRDLRELNKSKGILGALIPEPAKVTAAVSEVGQVAAKSFTKSFAEAAASAASASGPASIGVAIAGAIMAGASLPIVGATIAAGILGGAGIGGVIGGLKLAAKDTRVQAAAKSLGTEVSDTLNEAAGSFVPVALQGIEKIRGSFKRVSGDLKGIFDASSRYVGPLVDGVTGMVEQAIGGIRKAVAAAGPVIDVISRNLPVIGKTIGDVFEKVADNAPAAATALDQVFKVIEGGIVVVGGVVDVLSKLYAGLALSGALGKDAQENWKKYAVEAGIAATQSGNLAGQQEILGEKTKTAAEAAKQQKTAIEELNNLLRAEADPLFAFGEAQDKVAEAQTAYDKAVKEHGKNSKEAQAATRNLATSFEDLNDKASQIPTTTDGKLTPAFRRMLTEGGASEQQIKDIEAELVRLKTQADAYDGMDAKAKFSADTGQAAARVGALIAQLTKVRSKSITLRVGVVGASAAVRVASILSGRAEGGPVEAGTPYIVGEKRPEVFVPETNGTIVPSVGQYAGGARTGGSSTATAGRDGGGWVVVRGDPLVNTLIQAIAAQVGRTGRAAQLGIRFT